MAPKVAKVPGESRGMNGGLLQGLEVLLKGVVYVNRTTDSKSSCLVWSTRSLTTVFWFVDGRGSGGGGLKAIIVWSMAMATAGGCRSRVVWHQGAAQQSSAQQLWFLFHTALHIGSDFESIRPGNKDFESVALASLRFRLWVCRPQAHVALSLRTLPNYGHPHRIRLRVDPPKQQRLWVGCSGFLAIRTLSRSLSIHLKVSQLIILGLRHDTDVTTSTGLPSHSVHTSWTRQVYMHRVYVGEIMTSRLALKFLTNRFKGFSAYLWSYASTKLNGDPAEGKYNWILEWKRTYNNSLYSGLPIIRRTYSRSKPIRRVCHHLHLPPVQVWAGGGFFSTFRHLCHHYHLPPVQTRAGGGFFRPFQRACHHIASFASKHKPEEGLFDGFDVFATTTTSLPSKCEPEVDFFDISTPLPPLPSPSRPNASQRGVFSTFSTGLPPHHLPRVQTRAGGGSFWRFRRVCHHLHLPPVQVWAGGGFFRHFDTFATTTTSLLSKREPEGVFFRLFRQSCHHTTSLAYRCELEVVSCMHACRHTTSLTSRCELEVDFYVGDFSENKPEAATANAAIWPSHFVMNAAESDCRLTLLSPANALQDTVLVLYITSVIVYNKLINDFLW